jgi:ABC-type polysaccharide/polyol phosphate export permease
VGSYLAAVWRCRYFWLSLVKMDLETRYRRSLLGLGWSLLNPLVLTAILYTVFHGLFVANQPNYALYVLSGLVVWNFIAGSTIQGCHCFLHAEAYIRQQPSPLIIFPLRTALGGLVHFLAALAVVLAVAGFTQGLPSLATFACLIPGLLLLFALVWSTALLTGFANVFFRDTEHLAQVVFQLLFYATPIIYPAETLDQMHMSSLADYNPLAAFLRLLREPLYDRIPEWTTFATAGGTVAVLGLAAALVTSRWQRQLVFHL